MKKRILSVILALVMVLPVSLLTGCNNDDPRVLPKSDITPVTITLYTITDEETTEEARQAVEDELNRITEHDFNTHVILRTFTADEYDEVLAKDLAAAAENYVPEEEVVETDENGETVTTKEKITTNGETLETTKPKVETDKNGETKKVVVVQQQEVYPAENGTQVDIFLVNNVDNFNKFKAEGAIAPITTELAGNSKIITKYLNPLLLNSGKVFDFTANVEIPYGVANNHYIAEHEYVLLRKDLVDAKGVDAATINNLQKVRDFAAGATVVDTYGVEPNAITLFGEDSLYGSSIDSTLEQNHRKIPGNLLTDSTYQKEYAALKTMKSNGSLVEGTVDNLNNAACAFVRGSSATVEKYADNYYSAVYRRPIATNENVYNGMFCVSQYTQSLTRTMEVLTYLQTNTEFVNILRYGVEGEHYEWAAVEEGEEKYINIISDEYVMDSIHCGNQFLTYPNDKMSAEERALAADNWALAKEMNKNAIASPYLGFSALYSEVVFTEEKREGKLELVDAIEDVVELSEEYTELLEAYSGSGDAIISYMDEIGDELSDERAMDHMESNYENSPRPRFTTWHDAKFAEEEAAA